MANVDKLLQMMAQNDVQRAILIGDQPIRLFDATGEKKSGVVSKEWLETSLSDITPHYLNAKLMQNGRFQFQHDCTHGSFQASVERTGDTLKLYLVRLSASLIRDFGGGSAVPNMPPLVPAVNDSGGGAASTLPDELKGWNNGGGFLVWFWCIAHKAWMDLAMWSLGPVVFLLTYVLTREIVMALISLTLFGGPLFFFILFRFSNSANQTAWQNRRWDSIEQFKEVQKRWHHAGILSIPLLLMILFAGLWPLALVMLMSAIALASLIYVRNYK